MRLASFCFPDQWQMAPKVPKVPKVPNVPKVVRFASTEPSVREYATDTLHDRILTLKHAERGMLHLFTQTVDEIVETVLEHDEAYQAARSSTKTKKAERATENYKIMRRKEVIGRYVWNDGATDSDSDSEDSEDDSIWTLLGALGLYGSYTVKDVLLEVIEAIESHELEEELYLVAMFVLRAGFESFIAQGHCATKCHTVLNKGKLRPVPKEEPDQKTLQDACVKSHDRIEKALGIKDIQAFDKLLRVASGNKCSLFQ